MKITTEKFEHLVDCESKLTAVEDYLLSAIKDRSGNYVSTDIKTLICLTGTYDEATQMYKESQARLEAEENDSTDCE